MYFVIAIWLVLVLVVYLHQRQKAAVKKRREENERKQTARHESKRHDHRVNILNRLFNELKEASKDNHKLVVAKLEQNGAYSIFVSRIEREMLRNPVCQFDVVFMEDKPMVATCNNFYRAPAYYLASDPALDQSIRELRRQVREFGEG